MSSEYVALHALEPSSKMRYKMVKYIQLLQQLKNKTYQQYSMLLIPLHPCAFCAIQAWEKKMQEQLVLISDHTGSQLEREKF